MKVNFDGAVFDNSKATGVGCIGRDASGKCVAWLQQRFLFGTSPAAAETLAALEALRMARRRGWRKIELEGDCLGLISQLRANTRDLSMLGPLLNDIFDLVPFFDSVVFKCVRRLGNVPAHLLARSATVELEGDNILPPQVLSAVLSDYQYKHWSPRYNELNPCASRLHLDL
ncbi:hypothetical protein BUALT_Bualt18G0125600 [Buddleja alternifolia]|uniref:RNase H type-1 domain-containing protein n=1 Tax=Buddleja alternifolia TaxID=168488 RepID=A0AAV6WF33_9LAMI|nr:hypothetical protein BUALT_Bualt18G0125600 [Buddleja alternifolia]